MAERDAVLVLEVATSVAEFYLAVARVPGLDFLLGIDDLQEQDDDFRLDDPTKPIRGALYMVFSDLQARQELLSLWERWDRGETLPKNYGRFATVFQHLRSIRVWGPLDRIRETGLVDRWRELQELFEGTPRLAQIELWFHDDLAARRRAEASVGQRVEEVGGRVLSRYVLDPIRYHGLLIQVPPRVAESVLASPSDAMLLAQEELMFVRPLPQGVATAPADGEDSFAQPPPRPTNGTPVVALIDGVPLTNHPRLQHHVTVVDTDGLEERTPAARRRHGTAMASLIVHGDLGDPRPTLTRPIVARPVMEGTEVDREEHFPPTRLPLDMVHQAVVDLVHGENALARSVRIINLSLGDPAAVFHGPLSPWARLLDYLADRYSLLFVVSAGNHGGVLSLAPEGEAIDLERLVVANLRKQSRSRGLLSPAEAVNILTIGAVPVDAAVPDENDSRVDLVSTPDLPAVYSAWGRGFRRAVKPDVLAEGGRLRYRRVAQDSEEQVFEPAQGGKPGLQVAAPSSRPAASGLAHAAGTSHAAALTTGEAARLWEVLDEMGDPPEWMDDRVRPVLIRALIVHGAEWGAGLSTLRTLLPDLENGELNRLASQMLGYGRMRWERLRTTHPSRITLLAGGLVEEGAARIHRVPLPDALNAVAGRRRIITTLAWLTPINMRDQRYRAARLWTTTNLGPLTGMSGEGPTHHEAQRGTVEHRIYASERRSTLTNAEATVQVNCASDAGKLRRFVPYGLIVSVDTAPELDLPVHEQVAARVRQMATVRTRSRTRA